VSNDDLYHVAFIIKSESHKNQTKK